MQHNVSERRMWRDEAVKQEEEEVEEEEGKDSGGIFLSEETNVQK